MAEDPTARFADLVATHVDDLPLDAACLLIAAHALPDLDVDAELGRLDALAAGVRERTADGIVRHLCDDLGFAGDQDTYYDVRNSLLPAVLDRRRGIPISLAVVAIEVGRRLDVPLVGIGMPGHFLVQAEAGGSAYVDLFAGGAVLDRAGCRARFDALHAGTEWQDTFLAPVGPDRIVARVLANLVGAYRRAGSRRDLVWALGLRVLLPGASPVERRELAAVLAADGRFAEAADVLESLASDRDHASAARLRARLN